MKTEIKQLAEKLNVEVKEFDTHIGSIYAFYDEKFRLGFCIMIPNESEELCFLYPIINTLEPESITTIVVRGTLNAQFEAMKSKFRNTIHLSAEKAIGLYNDFVKRTEALQLSRSNMDMANQICNSVTETVKSMGGIYRGMKVIREDGAVSVLITSKCEVFSTLTIYAEFFNDKVKHVILNKDNELEFIESDPKEYIKKFFSIEVGSDEPDFALSTMGLEDIDKLRDYSVSLSKKFVEGFKCNVIKLQ